jgi:uncharacterized protein
LTTIEKLLVLQDRDRKIRQLSQECEDIPARKKLIETRLHSHQEELKQTQDELKHNASAIKQIEIDVDTNKLRILKLRDQQGMIKSNEEYRALEREISSVQKQIIDAEDREITLMEAGEKVRARLAEQEKSLAEEQKIVARDSAALDERKGNLVADLEKIKADRAGMVGDIPEDWLQRYERVFQHTGDYALVAIENKFCGGCHMALPPQVTQDVKKGLSLISCGYCGRILYWQP